jgi:hypothetical protein
MSGLADVPEALATQSHLGLACPHHQHASGTVQKATPSAPKLQPLPRIAVTTESKLGPWRKWQLRFQRRFRPVSPPKSLAEGLAERSGVGAGTEPCFACQGRIANLGALTVESDEGDKQTFSVWRCRMCYTLYLSNWIDRWERLESLETEEAIYRIAPIEAAECLTLFASVPAGDHPLGREQRGAQRAWLLNQIAGRQPLSHIVKQGR